MEQQLPSYTCIGAEDAPRSGFILHGILGSHRNWRSFARRLAADLNGWRFILVDLRCHGESASMAGPHRLSDCANDLQAIERELAQPIHAVVGHSFGGKVALEWSTRSRPNPAQVIVLDSPAGGTAARVQSSLAEAQDGPMDTDTSAVEKVIHQDHLQKQ